MTTQTIRYVLRGAALELHGAPSQRSIERNAFAHAPTLLRLDRCVRRAHDAVDERALPLAS